MVPTTLPPERSIASDALSTLARTSAARCTASASGRTRIVGKVANRSSDAFNQNCGASPTRTDTPHLGTGTVFPSSHVAVVQTRSLRGAPRCASGGPMTERPRGRLCSSLPASGTRSRHRGATSAARLLVGSMLILLGAACSSSATLREATSTRADGETYGFGHVTKLAEITVKKVFSTGSLQGPSNHIPSGSSPSPRRLVRLSEGSSVSSRTAHWPVIS